MVKKEFYATREDGVKLFRTYSDNNLYIRQIPTGVIYSEAIDVENANFSYEETADVIEPDAAIADMQLLEDRDNSTAINAEN